MSNNDWTPEKLGRLHADVMSVAEQTVWDVMALTGRTSAVARHRGVVVSGTGGAPSLPDRLRPWPEAMRLAADAYRESFADLRAFRSHLVVFSLIFGALAAGRPLGLAIPAFLQALLAFGCIFAPLGVLWEASIRARLEASGWGASGADLRRGPDPAMALRIAAWIHVIISPAMFLAWAAAILTFRNAEILRLVFWTALFGPAAFALFFSTSLAARDGRSLAESFRLLAGRRLSFFLGAVATLPPFLIGVSLCYSNAFSASIYSASCAVGLATLLWGGMAHARYLAGVYVESGGMR